MFYSSYISVPPLTAVKKPADSKNQF